MMAPMIKQTAAISTMLPLLTSLPPTAARSDKEGSNDSFGLIALCSVGPILMVLLLGIFYHPTEEDTLPPVISSTCSFKTCTAGSALTI